jgi:hypothetical protein
LKFVKACQIWRFRHRFNWLSDAVKTLKHQNKNGGWQILALFIGDNPPIFHAVSPLWLTNVAANCGFRLYEALQQEPVFILF